MMLEKTGLMCSSITIQQGVPNPSGRCSTSRIFSMLNAALVLALCPAPKPDRG